jgi:hypothetical protein
MSTGADATGASSGEAVDPYPALYICSDACQKIQGRADGSSLKEFGQSGKGSTDDGRVVFHLLFGLHRGSELLQFTLQFSVAFAQFVQLLIHTLQFLLLFQLHKPLVHQVIDLGFTSVPRIPYVTVGTGEGSERLSVLAELLEIELLHPFLYIIAQWS